MSSCSSIATEGEGDSGPAILPGFRFYPTDELLVGYYLKMKVEGKDSEFRHVIPEIDVHKHEPRDLPAFFKEPDFPEHEVEWFFFSRPDYKYTNSTRCNRATDQGFYKITGKEREIKARRSKDVIGKKRTLTFYLGRTPKAKRTNWVIHEYSLPKTDTKMGTNSDQQRDFVLCRLKNKSANYKKLKNDSICDEVVDSVTGGFNASNSEDDQAAPTDMISEPVEHLADKEPGDVLHGNGNYDEFTESPNGSCLVDNVNNDISTCDDNETDGWSFSDFDNQAAHDLFQELCAELGETLDSPLPPPQPNQPPQPHQPPQPPQPPHQPSQPHQSPQPPHQPPQPPQPPPQPPQPHQSPHQPPQPPQPPHQPPQPPQSQDYCSSTLQSPLYIKPGILPFVYDDDCSKWQSPIGGNNSCLTHKNNNSTNDHNEPCSSTAYSVQNPATDEKISEAFLQPEENVELFFDQFQQQDYTLMSPMITELGDVVHAQ